MRSNVDKFGKKSLQRFFLNLSILRLQSPIFEIIKQPKIVNLYQDKTQTFFLILNGKTNPIEHIILRMDYLTEEGYTFIQDVIIWKDNERYLHSPSVIIDKENSAI